MKLYLSSYRVPTPDDLFKLVGKQPQEIKVALIPNAKDYYSARPRNIKIKEVVNEFHKLGIKSKTVDLRDFDDAKELIIELDKFDLIWTMGGNTFMLRYQMKKSGFDQAIKQLLKRGKVYGGESAGAIVAGNSIKGIEFADPPEFAEEVIWEGMKLVDYFVLPHVGNGSYGSNIDEAIKLHKNDTTMIKLTDTQALVINCGKMKVVEGEKT